MQEENIIIGIDIEDKKIREELDNIITPMRGFLMESGFKGDCDILIKEIGDNLEKEFQLIQSLRDRGTVKYIFLTSPRTDPDMLIQALRAGAREFLPQPLKKDDVVNALLKVKFTHKGAVPNNAVRKKGKIINVLGGKGGIGTTTIAVNLAADLLETKPAGVSVALIDMNLLFGEVPLFLDIEPAFNWGEVVKNIVRLDSTYLMSILTKHPSGLYVLPSPTGLDGTDTATPDIIEKILRIMQREFDYIIIDAGQTIDNLSLKILEMSDTVLIVSILSLPCLINVKRLIDTFWRLGLNNDKVKIIINRYQKNSSITLNEAEKGLQKKIFWSIPNDYNATISAINQGKTLSAIAQKSEITKNLRDMTSKLIIKENAQVEKRGFLGLRLSEAKA